MPTQQMQLTGWRLKVRNWLASVLDHQRQSLFLDFNQAATSLQASFPPNFGIKLFAIVIKPLAVWIIKAAFRDAANDLGITISDATLEFLVELAVTGLLSA